MTEVGRRSDVADRLARIVNDVFAPWNLAIVMPPTVGALLTEPAWRGAVAGLVVSALGGLAPALLVWRGVHLGRYDDKFVVRRADRPKLLFSVVVLVAAALFIIYLLGAEARFLRITALMVLMSAVAAVITRWWKMSIHALLVAASVGILAVLEPWSSILIILVPVVIWARHRVGAHTLVQVMVGALVGAVFGVVAGWL